MKPRVASEGVWDLLEADHHQPAHIWGPSIASHNLCMVYGWRGVAKTRFCMRLAYTIASGGKFLEWNVGFKNSRRVLYIDGELGRASMARRLKAIVFESEMVPIADSLRILSYENCGPRIWNISDPADQKKYNAEIADASVIFIDNILSCTYPMNRHDDELSQWQRILPWLHMIRDTGRTVVLVHHTGKSGTQLGTSIKENWLDTIISLSPPLIEKPINGCEFTLRFEKTRDVKKSDAPALKVQLLEGDDGISRWYHSNFESNPSEEVLALKAKGMTRKEIASATGLSFKQVNDAIVGEQHEINF